MYAHALAGLKGFLSKVPMLAMLLLPHRLWWLAIILDVLEVWSCVWLFGFYGTMIARPHEIGEKNAVFYNGILKRVQVDRAEIVAVRALGTPKRRALPRTRGDGSAVLVMGGVPVVEVQLRRGEKVFVASDAPHALCGMLLA